MSFCLISKSYFAGSKEGRKHQFHTIPSLRYQLFENFPLRQLSLVRSRIAKLVQYTEQTMKRTCTWYVRNEVLEGFNRKKASAVSRTVHWTTCNNN
jgi:hypothetical protein